jgi:hypothetical protein
MVKRLAVLPRAIAVRMRLEIAPASGAVGEAGVRAPEGSESPAELPGVQQGLSRLRGAVHSDPSHTAAPPAPRALEITPEGRRIMDPAEIITQKAIAPFMPKPTPAPPVSPEELAEAVQKRADRLDRKRFAQIETLRQEARGLRAEIAALRKDVARWVARLENVAWESLQDGNEFVSVLAEMRAAAGGGNGA